MAPARHPKLDIKRDLNTAYYQAVANGRRRKCQIIALRDGANTITEPEALAQHIYAFYRELLASGERGGAILANSAWAVGGKVTEAENEWLTAPFSMVELEFALSATGTNTAPGPDGFPVTFYKKFWPLVGRRMLELLDDFTRGKN